MTAQAAGVKARNRCASPAIPPDMPRHRRLRPLRPGLIAAPALLLSACIVSQPQDMRLQSPDGQFVLEADFSGGGITLVPGLSAELSLRHQDGEPTQVASLDAIRQLEIAWTAPRALRICAQGAEPAQDQTVTVDTPQGPAEFAVSYGCPARPATGG